MPARTTHRSKAKKFARPPPKKATPAKKAKVLSEAAKLARKQEVIAEFSKECERRRAEMNATYTNYLTKACEKLQAFIDRPPAVAIKAPAPADMPQLQPAVLGNDVETEEVKKKDTANGGKKKRARSARR